jgi:hypothetical protein
MSNDLPPWDTIYNDAALTESSGYEDIFRDLRTLMREINDRMPQPRGAVLVSRTVQSTPKNNGRAGYDGPKHRKGSKVHLAVDTLAQLLAVLATPVNEHDQAQVAALANRYRG